MQLHSQPFFKSILTATFLVLCSLLLGSQSSLAQGAAGQEQQIIELSKKKWQWMADKNVDELAKLFDDKAKFVHMSGTWKKTKSSKSSRPEVYGTKRQTSKMLLSRLWGTRQSFGAGLCYQQW